MFIVETKLKFVEIMMISVSDLAPALAILGVVILSIYSVSALVKKEYYLCW